MNLRTHYPVLRRLSAGGFTLVEMFVAAGLFALALAAVITLLMYGLKSFGVMGNYVDMDIKSRNAVDEISREIRNSSALLSFSSSSTGKSLTLTNESASPPMTITLAFSPSARTLTLAKTGQPTKTLLTECDQFDFSLYNRAPKLSTANITFYGATNGTGTVQAHYCKLINMSWKCSRKILGSALTTESVQTAQIVLRNKVK